MDVLGIEGPRVLDAPEQYHREVAEHLENVLKSPPFCSSQRSCQFLRHVVGSMLAGEAEQLKERLIGERIFGRPLDYDTGQDSIVRVKANEVRRRLAQYYDLHPESPWRIELPPGAYVPQIQRVHSHMVLDEVPVVVETTARVSSFKPWWKRRLAVRAMVLLGAIVVAATLWFTMRPSRTPALFSRFWEPFLSSRHELMLCIPTPETYRIYGNGRETLIDAFRARPPGGAGFRLPAENELKGVQIVPEPGLSLGLGDAHAMTLLYAFAAGLGKTPNIRLGNDTTFTDLRAGPNVLIGGVTNRWTIDLMADARFAFVREGTTFVLRDKKTGELMCRKPAPWEPRSSEDCAVITRMPNSKTGHPLLVAAGLDHFGTYAVGEFLTRPHLLEGALRRAPADWAEKNMQIVFRIEVVHDNIGPQRVLATHIW